MSCFKSTWALFFENKWHTFGYSTTIDTEINLCDDKSKFMVKIFVHMSFLRYDYLIKLNQTCFEIDYNFGIWL